MGRHRTAAATRTTQAQGRQAPNTGQGGAHRHHLRPKEWHPLENAAPRDGLRLRQHLLAAPTRLGDAYSHALRAHQGRTFFNVLDGFYLHHEVEALLRGGDERSAREEVSRFAESAEVNERERVAYLRSLAVLSEFEGDTEKAIDHLHEAQALAQKIGVPGELWQIQGRLGELHERRGEDGEAREAFSGAAQTLRMLAGKIGDEKLREGFLSAPQVRRVLGHN